MRYLDLEAVFKIEIYIIVAALVYLIGGINSANDAHKETRVRRTAITRKITAIEVVLLSAMLGWYSTIC